MRRWRKLYRRRGEFYSVPPAIPPGPQALTPGRLRRKRHWRPKRRGMIYKVPLVGLAPVVVQRVPDEIAPSRRRRIALRRRGQFYPMRTAVTPVVVTVVPAYLTRRNRFVMLSRTRRGRFYRVPKIFLPLRDITVEVAFPGVSWAADGPTARSVGGRLEKGSWAVRSPSVAWEVMSPTE